jgi:hypothetical protein
MLDAGGEYKSEAFLKTLKDTGISINQSAPHTPQQNGHVERLMRTLMDKAQSMRLDTCLPQSWWEFAVLHATHVYNRMPLQRTKWETPYTNLHGEASNISHLQVFGCGAYVHIPKETRVNALSPKSELMVYLGHTEGIKACMFMRLSNNTVYTSTTTLFDETLFPKCGKLSPKGTTHLNEPRALKPSDADQDDPLPPFEPKRDAPAPNRAQEAPEEEPPAVPPSPPPAPEPVPLRRSVRLRKVPTHPDNAYGECRHPTDIEKGIRQTRTWKEMTESEPGSSRTQQPSEQPPADNAAPPGALSERSPHNSDDDEVEDILHLQREGGVQFLNHLLAKAVPPDSESLDSANVQEWTFKDIHKMPSDA